MHILVTNDDGPPSAESSPYVLPFVRHLERAGHTVSVVLPHTQRSWIGKAHIVGQDVQATSYYPSDISSTTSNDSNDTNKSGSKTRPWILVNSTPATCSQIGLNHLFHPSSSSSPALPPIDLVVSGPNYGRNTTGVFALSSGTLGAALEAAVCGARAIALSFAFFDRENRSEDVGAACRQAVRVVEWVYEHGDWDADGAGAGAGIKGRLFSVNVPVRKDVESKRVVWTRVLQNEWTSGSCFEEVSAAVEEQEPTSPEAEERGLRLREEAGKDAGDGDGDRRKTDSGDDGEWKTKHFKWAPKFKDVYQSVLDAGPGSDGWAVKEGETSITALRANFMHVDGFSGEVKL